MIDAQTLETLRTFATADIVRLIICGIIGAFIGELNRNYSKFSVTLFLISFLSSAFMAVIAGIIFLEVVKIKPPLLEAASAFCGYIGHKKVVKWIIEKKDKLLEKGD